MKKSILLVFALLISVLLSAVSHDVSFSIADLELSQEDRGYDVIRIDELLITNERTKPELPIKFVNLIIPCGMEVDDISITTQQQDIDGNFMVNPSPGPMIITDPPSPAEPDQEIYGSSNIYPNECVEVISHGYFDGANRIVTLAVYPVQFNPVQNTLIFNSNIGFTLSFTSSESPDATPLYRLSKYDVLYDNALRSIVENDIDVGTYKHQPEIIDQHREGDFDMLIIGEDEYASDFSDFITWKEKKGMRVLYVAYDTASFDTNYPNGDNWGSHPLNDKAGKIRACLKEYYESHGTVYALIVGGSTDWDNTPQPNDAMLPVRYGTAINNSWKRILSWTTNNNWWRTPADLYFCDFGGDYDVEGDPNGYYGEPNDDVQKEPEIFVGRIVISEQEDVDNHEQIRRWTEKLITYETNPGYGDFDYLEKSKLFDGFWYHSSTNTSKIYDGTLENILNTNFNDYQYIEPLRPNYPSGQQTIQYLNDGLGLSHFYWHGAKYLIDNHASPDDDGGRIIASLDLYDDTYQVESNNGFDNFVENGKFGICYMVSCNPGSYDKSINGSGYDYWGERISMGEAYTSFLDNVGGPAIVANTNVGYGGDSEHIEKNFLINIFEDNFYNIGWALGNAKSLGTTWHEHILMLCTTLFGDPEMEIWTDIPEYLDVHHDYATNTVTVTCDGIPVENADVYFATANGGETFFDQTDANGVLQCNFDYQEICVNKHNYIPIINRIVRGTETWTETTDLKWDVIVPYGSTLNINSEVNLLSFGGKSAQIIVENGATLNVNENAVINGYNKTFVPDESSAIQIEIPGNKIEVYGSLNVDNASFTSIDDNYWDGVFIHDCGNISMINPTFENCNLTSEDTGVTICDGAFTNSWMKQYREDIEIDGVTFTNSFFYANGISDSPIQQSQKVTIENCSFNNSLSGNAIYITTYSDFEILNNSSINCNGTGINIQESGTGKTHIIENNQICGSSSGMGIILYHTYADIIGYNNIHDKSAGIVGYHNCEITLLGNEDAPYQIIRNNVRDEVVFTHDSFPTIFHYNKIYDNTHEYDLVRCNGHEGGVRVHDITMNYWGSIFDPELDFYPVGAFDYTPQWNPIPTDPKDSELLYAQAMQYEVEENYDLARLTYKAVIETFPESEFAIASAKQLLALEKKIESSDFAALQTYYETEPNMSYDADMQKLSEDLSNYCDIEMTNYETAIGYSETIITNPPSLQDSVFAVIDAGYTYLLMENAGRSGFVGQIASLKPKSKEDFENNRDNLLSGLLGYDEENDEQNMIPKVAVLNNNYPNPFNPTTTISFSIPNESKVNLIVYNIKGQKVKTLVNNDLDRGNHSVVWNGFDENYKTVSSGVYFYKLSVNGKSKSVKKCLMLK